MFFFLLSIVKLKSALIYIQYCICFGYVVKRQRQHKKEQKCPHLCIIAFYIRGCVVVKPNCFFFGKQVKPNCFPRKVKAPGKLVIILYQATLNIFLVPIIKHHYLD